MEDKVQQLRDHHKQQQVLTDQGQTEEANSDTQQEGNIELRKTEDVGQDQDSLSSESEAGDKVKNLPPYFLPPPPSPLSPPSFLTCVPCSLLSGQRPIRP